MLPSCIDFSVAPHPPVGSYVHWAQAVLAANHDIQLSDSTEAGGWGLGARGLNIGACHLLLLWLRWALLVRHKLFDNALG